MDCTSCGHHNRPGARFCASCGASLERTRACPSCGAERQPGASFCDSCGRALTEVPGGRERSFVPEHLAAKIRAGAGALEGERKQVTVLFADVVGSLDLERELDDPEAWRAVMERFFEILCEGVHRFEGTVDKFTGDGMMAMFGAPIAHEDHARRACYAAVHLQQELAPFAAELRRERGLTFLVRMGLNSGEVVVGAIGEDLRMEYTAFGPTIGLGKRMEALAAPGTVFVSEHTASLVEGYLQLRDLGEFEVKGAGRALRVYELGGVGAVRSSIDVRRARGLSRLVGREEEMRTLERAREQAFGGQGQVVGIVGEAGVGKSRLCYEFVQRQRAKGTPVYYVAGHAHAKSVPLLPVLALLRAYFDISERDSDKAARERIAGRLLGMDDRFVDDLPLLFDFLGVSDPEHPGERMDPEARQRRLLSLTKHLVHAESARQPSVTVFEDLHWWDPASEAFLANHVEAVQGTRNLTVVDFRPDYQAPWKSRSYYRQIALSPLGRGAVEELLADLLGRDPSLDGLSELILARTEGNPFFIEELVRALVDAGNLEGQHGAYRLVRPIDEVSVPASVQAVLLARIDRLEPLEKTVLQTAAVIGKEFPEPVLARIVDLQQAALEGALATLVAGELIYEQELYPERAYSFKHPLTREVAYGSQLSQRRAAVHAAVARAIADQYPERLDERAALLAQHWEAADEKLEAARWHTRAAAWAGTNDPTQALRHWRKVRELADALPDSPEAAMLGLTARIFLLHYGWRLGLSHEEAEVLFGEAERLASNAGDVRSHAILLSAYGNFRGMSDGDVREYAHLSRRAIALAEDSGDPTLYVAIAPSAYAAFLVGEYREGVAMLDRGIELANGDPSVGAGTAIGCPYAFCHVFKGLMLSYLGGLEEAGRVIEHGGRLAREQGDIETLGMSHMASAWRGYFTGDTEAMFENARRAVEIAERIGDSFGRAWAWFYLGVAECMGGDCHRAIKALERSRAITTERRTAAYFDAFCLAWLGEAYLGVGNTERAHALVDEAVQIARAQGNVPAQMDATLALVRVLLGSTGPAARQQIEGALKHLLELLRETEAKAFEPLIHVELAELARKLSDEEGRERELRDAHRLFTEIGATGHADRLAVELATPAD